jgi:hypothetical protein
MVDPVRKKKLTMPKMLFAGTNENTDRRRDQALY